MSECGTFRTRKDLSMGKLEMRRQLQADLVALSIEQRAEQSKRACQNLIDTAQFRKASVVMLYLSLPHEVDTTSIILHAWQQEKIVAVPKVSWQQRHMIPVEITTLDTGFSTETGGLRNPTTGLPVPLEDIDLVVTPGLAFDMKGNRLGRGGSYYDRFFASELLKAERFGLVFNQQIVEAVPVESHDQPVDVIITDEGVFNCG